MTDLQQTMQDAIRRAGPGEVVELPPGVNPADVRMTDTADTTLPPEEFILWLNGALDLMSDEPPTPEQWEKVRAKMAGAVGQVVAQRMRERAKVQHFEQVKAQRATIRTQATSAYAQAMDKAAFEALSAMDLGSVIVPPPPKKKWWKPFT